MEIKEVLRNFKQEFDTRYVVRGLIDGSLSTLGVVIGASGGETSIIIAAGIGGGIANGISNILGALTAERAIIEEEREKKEKSLLIGNGNLKGTHEYQYKLNKTMYSGTYDGLSTCVGAVIPVIPFFIFEQSTALIMAIAFTLLILLGLGIFIGKLSRDNLLISGLKMVLGGVIVAMICFGVESLFG
ncbi:TIGR00267 family protein [Methanococcus maripaludis]|uniref:Putative membrane protein (TIGR00267 family) n=1 Tax=Methanococcus maripaludis TaxID=39152 RepID=A0A2L1C952_METMI|nr:TIGR00267 family protein [Methanococcus maripaludis]AVB75730.1 VIT family protein [Methanococcus maripaludis]MBA2864146.1 putative membrane protein (TIGR00267 family) [Methanococcus maripaludis]MBB6497072.1 putative membrane protein (TIGR00267 family) [Methanococcus maripaludis]